MALTRNAGSITVQVHVCVLKDMKVTHIVQMDAAENARVMMTAYQTLRALDLNALILALELVDS